MLYITYKLYPLRCSYVENSNPQCDSIWRWSPWEIFGVRLGYDVGGLLMGLVTL